MGVMGTDEIAEYLDALQREDCYRIDAVLKESPYEVTQKVCFVGANGAERGHYIRKYINRESGMGSAYERIYEAQQLGRRFMHLPRIIECYEHGDDLAVVMEYINGETLQDHVYRLDPSLELATKVFPELCDAVTELHEGFNPPLIHRDLKPSNIILSQGGLTIIDFGIAREYKEGAEADTVQFGTREFAPPEQFGFGQTTVRSDVYALGMVLYFCLTETIPTSAIREGGFSDPRISGPMRDVIVQATSFAPNARFSSARALKAAFLSTASSSNASSSGEQQASYASSQPPRPAQMPQSARPAQMPQSTQSPQPASPSGDSSPAPTAYPQYPAQKEPTERYRVLGIVWNVLLIALAIAVFAYSFAALGNPSADFATYSLLRRVIVLGFLTPLAWLCVTYLIMDKRRLRTRFTWMQKVRWWHVVIGFLALTMIMAIVLYAVEGPVG